MQQQTKTEFDIPREFIFRSLKIKEWLKQGFNDDYQFDLLNFIFDHLKNVKSNKDVCEKQKILHYVLIKCLLNCLIDQYNFKSDNLQLNFNSTVEKTNLQNVYKNMIRLQCNNQNDLFYQSLLKMTIKRMDRLIIQWDSTDEYVIMELIYLMKLILECFESKMKHITSVCDTMKEERMMETYLKDKIKSIYMQTKSDDKKASLSSLNKYLDVMGRTYKKKDYLQKLKEFKTKLDDF